MSGCHVPNGQIGDDPEKRFIEMLGALDHKLNTRIEKLEKSISDIKDHDERIHDLENISAEQRLIRLESSKLTEELNPQVWVFVNQRLDDLESMTSMLHLMIRSIGYTVPMDRTPHKCPLCDSKGFVRTGIAEGHRCEPCDGKGIVWG